MRIIWTQAAAKERAQIWDHLYALNPRAAAEMDKRFSDAVSRLSHNPKTGQAGIIIGTRELIPHPSYRLVYQIEQLCSVDFDVDSYRSNVAATR